MILRDLRIHALVSEHLSMWSLLLQTLHILAEKELYQSAQLGVYWMSQLIVSVGKCGFLLHEATACAPRLGVKFFWLDFMVE